MSKIRRKSKNSCFLECEKDWMISNQSLHLYPVQTFIVSGETTMLIMDDAMIGNNNYYCMIAIYGAGRRKVGFSKERERES
jgi:hypothetical protein